MPSFSQEFLSRLSFDRRRSAPCGGCRSVVPESYRASALRVEAALIDFRSLEMVLHANRRLHLPPESPS